MIKGRMWWEWLFWAVVVSWVIDGWLNPAPVGQKCGPEHHWRYIQSNPGEDMELSCEQDR